MKSISKKMTLFTVLLIIISLLVATFASVGIIYNTTKALTDQTLTETAIVAADRVSWELKSMLNVAIQAGCNPKLSSVVDSPALYKLPISYISSFFVGGFRFFNHDYNGLEIKNEELDRLQKKFYYLHSDTMQHYTPKGYFEVLRMDETLRRLRGR